MDQGRLKIIPYKGFWLAISGLLLVLSIVFWGIWGLNLGIDFTGGSLLEAQFTEKFPTQTEIRSVLEPLELGEITVQPTDDKTAIMRFKSVDDATHTKILETLNKEFGGEKKDAVKERRFDSVGSIIGKELKTKAVYALIILMVVVIIYVAFAFRKVSWPVQSWKYGVVTMLAGFHDVIGVVGVFALLGYFWGVEVNAPFIAAILTVFSYSINDSIVILDRIRENLNKQELKFSEVVNLSLNETIARSINTTVTTLLALVAVFIFGGESVRFFVLAMIIGILFGAYSSIFVASPLLVAWYNWSRRKSV